jgi:hypothetical protein
MNIHNDEKTSFSGVLGRFGREDEERDTIWSGDKLEVTDIRGRNVMVNELRDVYVQGIMWGVRLVDWLVH